MENDRSAILNRCYEAYTVTGDFFLANESGFRRHLALSFSLSLFFFFNSRVVNNTPAVAWLACKLNGRVNSSVVYEERAADVGNWGGR